MTWRLLRLFLIFGSIVFLRLKLSPSIVTLFIIVVIRDPKEIFFRALRPFFMGCHIIPVSKNIRTRVFLFIFLLLKPFFRLLSSLLGGLYIARGIICRPGIWGV